MGTTIEGDADAAAHASEEPGRSAGASPDAPDGHPAWHPADRLVARVDARRAPVCVGLDPVLGRLPAACLGDAAGLVGVVDGAAADAAPLGQDDRARAADAIERFSLDVIDAVARSVPAIKPQSACYERFGWPGVRALERVIAHARLRGLEVILDVKRGDIGTTAAHYAAACVALGADWMTASPYLGRDGLDPLLAAGLGVFSLVRTSNPSGDRVQNTPTTGDGTIADTMATLVRELGDEHAGQRGWSALGAVVGATRPTDAARLRAAMPRQLFLVPGFGAQGGGVDDVLPCFDGSGGGALVTASRSVIYAAAPDDPAWTNAVADAAASLADDIGRATGHRR